MTNYPFLNEAAQSGKPILLSTGMGDMAEVTKAVEIFKKSDSSNNVNATFQVDMKGQTISGTGVWLSGGNISSGQPGGLQMQPVIDTTLWEITLTLPPNSSYTYKYRNGHYPNTWSGGWETVPDDCGQGQYNDRTLSVMESDTTLPVICFSECIACD